jgi:hypothetical protein
MTFNGSGISVSTNPDSYGLSAFIRPHPRESAVAFFPGI